MIRFNLNVGVRSALTGARPIAGLVLAMACLVATLPARAQIILPGAGASGGAENIEGLTVAGKAAVAARPNLAEIDLEISAASELTADAIVKYRDAKRRLRDAFGGLKLDNISLEERGLLVDRKGMQPNPYYFDFQQNTRTKTEVQLARKLVVKVSNVRRMDEDALLQLVAKLLDVAQDAGAQVGARTEFNPYYYNPNFGPKGLVRFVVDDFDKLQDEAYEKAIADARARARRLARLSGVELGPIVGVREVQVPGQPRPTLGFREPEPDANDEPLRPTRLESMKFQEIPIRVELLVRFEVRPPAEAKSRAGQP